MSMSTSGCGATRVSPNYVPQATPSRCALGAADGGRYVGVNDRFWPKADIEHAELRAQHPAGGGAGERALLPGDGAVDQRHLDAARALDHALAAARQVVQALGARRHADAGGVEEHQVRGQPGRNPASVPDTEEIRRI